MDAEYMDELNALRRAVSKLSQEEQSLLGEFYSHGCSLGEIAAKLELPVGTVKSRLFAIRARIRNQIYSTVGDTIVSTNADCTQ